MQVERDDIKQDVTEPTELRRELHSFRPTTENASHCFMLDTSKVRMDVQ